MGSDDYSIRPDYVARDEPDYYHDVEAGPGDTSGVVWQPDVYTHARDVARVLGATRIVDVGCGSGKKLVALAQEGFDVIGVDYGANIAACRQSYSVGRWVEFDLSHPEGWIPLEPADWSGSVVVNSDVVEHLAQPEHLMRQLARGLESAAALVVSTPDRVETYGPKHLGPPPNPAHVREWQKDEFAAFLRSQGFRHLDVELTRSHTGSWDLMTILARVYPDEETARKVRSAGLTLPQPPVTERLKRSGAVRRLRRTVAAVPGARTLRDTLRR